MYSTVLTQIGMAQLINSQITGSTLKWSKMGVGDGNGLPIVVDSNRTALVNERYRAGINHLYRDTQDPTQIIAELVMMPEEGGYTIREVGIYDTDDNLVVYGSLPEVVKPVLAEGSGITLTVRCRAAIGNAASVRLIIDPSTVMVTRKYVNDELSAHYEATDAHPLASDSRPGFMSAADKMAVDKSFRGIKVGDSILYPSGNHQYAELVPESPVILTPDPATGKITVAVNASVTAKAGAVPVADIAAKLEPSWGIIPVGGIVWLALDTVPDGFLLCNGALVSRSAYSRLFAAIGTKWGAGDGSTTFALPDMSGRVPWGAATAGSYISAGLPNIIGNFRSADLGASEEATGAFREIRVINTGLTRAPSSSMDFDKHIEFKASLSNTIFGASDTVQPPAATLLSLIKY